MTTFIDLYPKKLEARRKGDNGVILIIGGSKEYVGAPYFSAMAAFRTGADLVYIFTNFEALIPLKTLVPDAIVVEIEFREWILQRVTSCILGTGLGVLKNEVLEEIVKIIAFLKERSVPLIIDGDGLKVYNEAVFKDYMPLILTPNVNEMKKTRWIQPEHYIIEKGFRDIIRYKDESCIINTPGSNKRCCGQGDLLVGILAVFLTWGTSLKECNFLSCLRYGCIITRSSSRKGYEKKRMGLISGDILEEIPDAINELYEDELRDKNV